MFLYIRQPYAKYCVQYLRYKQIALNIDILVFKDLYRIGLDLILYNVLT